MHYHNCGSAFFTYLCFCLNMKEKGELTCIKDRGSIYQLLSIKYMKIKKNIIAISALAVIVVLGLVAVSSVSAYQGNPNVKGPNYIAEKHDAMKKAFTSNDYNAWKNLMQGRGRVAQVVTKENFAKFAEAHNLALQGKISEANVIREELGLGLKDGNGQRGAFGFTKGQGMRYGRMIK